MQRNRIHKTKEYQVLRMFQTTDVNLVHGIERWTPGLLRDATHLDNHHPTDMKIIQAVLLDMHKGCSSFLLLGQPAVRS